MYIYAHNFEILEEIVVGKELLKVLACPICKGQLVFDESNQELICRFDKLAYPVRDGIPVMLVDEARKLDDEG